MSGDLPEGWAEAPLRDLLREPLRNGHSARASADGKGVRTLTLSAVTYGQFCDANTKVTVAHPGRVTDLWLEPGDLLIERSNTPELVGTARLFRGKSHWAIFPDLVVRARFSTAVIPEFVEAFLQSKAVRDYFTENAQGTAGSMPKIDQGMIERLAVALPPPVEQRRIVAKIEVLLAEVNAARERLAKMPAILKRFRQSVLVAACSGHLTEDWRAVHPNEDSGGVLLRRVREERKRLRLDVPFDDAIVGEDDSEQPETWVTASLGNLAKYVTSGSRGWAEFYSDKGPLFIRAQDIKTDTLVLDALAHVAPPKGAEGTRTRVQGDDLLITITGANVTKSALVPKNLDEAYVSQHVALVRLLLPGLAPWVQLWTISPAHGRRQLLDAAYGAGKPGLNLDNIRGLKVSLPPESEQHEIVRRVEALFRVADVIEKHVAAATALSDKVTQAVLARAFRGELVATEAELARAEGREYEPANALLERIARERRVVAGIEPRRRRGRPAA
jgi:type I restriction enzyme S subunit